MEIISELNAVYKIDGSVCTILQKLSELEMSGRKDSTEYARHLSYLEMVLEEEQRIIDESFNDIDFLDDVLSAHDELLSANFNHYDLALSYNLEELQIRRVYLKLLDKYIGMTRNNNTDYGPVINLSLQTSFYCEALKSCKNPEVKYRLAYICADMEEKLMFCSFNIEDIGIPELYMSFLSNQKNYEIVKMKFILDKVRALLSKLFRDHKILGNLEEYLNYFRAIICKLNPVEIAQVKDVFFELSIINNKEQEICSKIEEVFEQIPVKKLD